MNLLKNWVKETYKTLKNQIAPGVLFVCPVVMQAYHNFGNTRLNSVINNTSDLTCLNR